MFQIASLPGIHLFGLSVFLTLNLLFFLDLLFTTYLIYSPLSPQFTALLFVLSIISDI